jgi:hypothetical protein
MGRHTHAAADQPGPGSPTRNQSLQALHISSQAYRGCMQTVTEGYHGSHSAIHPRSVGGTPTSHTDQSRTGRRGQDQRTSRGRMSGQDSDKEPPRGMIWSAWEELSESPYPWQEPARSAKPFRSPWVRGKNTTPTQPN